MEFSTTDASYPSTFNRSLQGKFNRRLKTEGRNGPQSIVGNMSAAVNMQSPVIKSQGPTSPSASLYVPWTDHCHSVSILPAQNLNPSFNSNEDPNAPFHTDYHSTWGFHHVPTNAMGHSVPSSFSSNPELSDPSITDTTGILGYGSVPILMNKHARGILTPELSPQSMSVSPVSNGHWPSRDDCREEALRESLNGAEMSSATVLRSDGQRKKNAKVEIPQERTIESIDEMISKAKCEEMVKELKVQKRLLKNREAALQSRQRKKQHTENLEGEKKRFMTHISGLENSLAVMRAGNQQLEHEKLQLEWQKGEIDKLVHVLQTENSKLKHQVSSLREVFHPSHSSPTSSNPHSSAFGEYSEDMNPITFNTGEWMRLIGTPCFDIVGDETPLNRVSSSGTTMSEHSHSLDGLKATNRAAAAHLLLIIVMAGALIRSSHDPERSIVLLIRQLPDRIKGVVVKVMDHIMQTQSFNILECLPDLRPQSLEFRPGDLDQFALEVILTMHNSVTSDVLHELNLLVERGLTGNHGPDWPHAQRTTMDKHIR